MSQIPRRHSGTLPGRQVIFHGYDPKFDKSFERLNPEQREAVECLDGPLLVIAGPGTGKTQLLSLRAANILAKRDAARATSSASPIPRRARKAMRKRLIELIGRRLRHRSQHVPRICKQHQVALSRVLHAPFDRHACYQPAPARDF
ncbi:MAG: UvrD-helicase domain-containing protein [Collinsella sp.]